MKHSKILVLLAVACMLTGLIAVVSCDSTSKSPTAPDLAMKQFDADGIRVNGTESCGKCGEVHQLCAVGYGDRELHFCTRADAQMHLDRIKNGDR